jgi:hypothetical protein
MMEDSTGPVKRLGSVQGYLELLLMVSAVKQFMEPSRDDLSDGIQTIVHINRRIASCSAW